MYVTNKYKEPGAICKKCHNIDKIYCDFCFCPRYFTPNCGGNYKILENGVKDCSDCIIPHTKEFVESQNKIRGVNSMQDFKNKLCIIDGKILRKCIEQDLVRRECYFELNPKFKELDCGRFNVPSIAISMLRVKLFDLYEVNALILNEILKDEVHANNAE